MKPIRILFFVGLLLLPVSSVFAQKNPKIEQLFAQKKRSEQWYKDLTKELRAIQYNTEPAVLLQYLNKLNTSYQPNLKSPDYLDFLLLKLNVLGKLGKYDLAKRELHVFIDQLGRSANDDEYAALWIELAAIDYQQGNLDSMSINLAIAKEKISVGSPDHYDWLMSKASELSAKGNYTQSIKLILEAAGYYEKTGNDNSLAVAYNNLGDNYIPLNKPMEAVKYFLKAAELNKKIGNKHGLCMNYNNAGTRYSAANRLDEAISYYQLAFTLAKELQDPLLMAQNIMNRGNVYEKKKDYAKAKQAFTDCLAICEQNGIDFGKVLSFLNLANVAMLNQEYTLAESYLNKAELLTQKMGLVAQQAIVFEKRAKLYAAKGDYRKAYQSQERHHALSDSLYSQKIQQEALELKEKYESEKKSNEINQLNKEKLSQQLIIALMGLGFLLLVILFQRLRIQQKLTLNEKQQDELQKTYLRSMLDAKNKELTAQAAQLLQMQNDVKVVNENIAEVIDGEPNLQAENRKKIKQALQKNRLSRLNADFDKRITDTNADFYQILLQKHPDLTPTELKICAYLRLNISTKEISQLTSRSVRTIESIRTDVRKKMKLKASDNLINYLISLI